MKQRAFLVGFLLLGLVAAVFTALSMLVAIFVNPKQALVMAVGFDQLANTGLYGHEDETISSRMGKAVREGRCFGCYLICRFLHRLDPHHCKKSIEEDEGH